MNTEWQNELMRMLNPCPPACHVVVSLPRQAGATTFAARVEEELDFASMTWHIWRDRVRSDEVIADVKSGRKYGLILDGYDPKSAPNWLQSGIKELADHTVVMLQTVDPTSDNTPRATFSVKFTTF